MKTYFRNLNYGWIIAVASFFVIAMNAMALLGFGVFLKPLTEDFGWERGELSTVFSIAVLIGGILSLISGRLVDKLGPRVLVSIAGVALATAFFTSSRITELWHLYFTFALPLGITISCTVIPINAMIPRWFTEKRGLAMSFPPVGFSAGGVVAPILIERMINSGGWQWAFMILAIFPLVLTVPLAQLMKHNPPEPETPNDVCETETKVEGGEESVNTKEHFSVTNALKDKWLWAFGAMQFSFGFSTQMILVHVVPYGTDVGLSSTVAAGILSFSSAIGILGSLGNGSLADRMNPRILLIVNFSLLTLSLILLVFAQGVFMFYLFACIFGFARGAVALLQTITGVNVFGVRNFGFYMGTFLLCGTLGGVVGTPVAGFIFDSTDSYTVAFIMAIVFTSIAIFVSTLILRHKHVKIC